MNVLTADAPAASARLAQRSMPKKEVSLPTPPDGVYVGDPIDPNALRIGVGEIVTRISEYPDVRDRILESSPAMANAFFSLLRQGIRSQLLQPIDSHWREELLAIYKKSFVDQSELGD